MKQNSEFPFRGSTKKFTFFSTDDGDFVRPRSKKVDKQRIDSDPKFATTKNQYTEFTEVMNSAKLLRNAFRLLVKNAKSRHTGRRLTSLLFKIIKTDTSNGHGQRNIANSNVKMLEQFDFNDQVKLENSLFAKYTPVVTRATGFVDVNVQTFIPEDALNPPAGATHYRLVMAAAELDFANRTVNAVQAGSDQILINRDDSPPFQLRAPLTPNSANVIVVVLGLEFYKHSGTTVTLLAPTALAIISASKP
jgi:hypothetical protein